MEIHPAWSAGCSVQACRVLRCDCHRCMKAKRLHCLANQAFFAEAHLLPLCSPTAVVVRRSMSSAVGAMYKTATGDRSGDAPHRWRRSLHAYRRSSLSGSRRPRESFRHPVACSPVRQGTWLQRRRNVPPGTWRHVHAKVAERYRNASARCCSTSWPIDRRCLNACLRAPTPAARRRNQTSLWHARYLRRIRTLRRFCRRSDSKLSAMPLGIICLPTGTPPAFSIFWWISPSFCLSS